MVVVTVDAGGVHFLSDGIGHCGCDAALHGADKAAQTEDRYQVRGFNCDVSVLYLRY